MKWKDKALVILTPGFPASDEDTTCLPQLQALTRSLHLQFPHIQIIVFSFHYPFRSDVYQCAGAEVHSFNGRNRGNIFEAIVKAKVSRQLQLLHERRNIIGLLSCWYGVCAEAAEKFCRKRGIPHYCWMLGQDAKQGNKFVRRLHLPSEKLVALSDSLAREFYKNYGLLPANVIPPGLDLSRYHFPARQRDIDILGVGSLIPLKRWDVFVKTCAAFIAVNQKLRCIIIGDGPEKQRLQEQIIKLNLQSNVFLPGELHHEKVLECMNRAKLLLHTSSYEGFSGVCMEALACGAHVVSFTKPMDHSIDYWHVVENEMEMLKEVLKLLQAASHDPVMDFPVEHTAWRLMELFHENPVEAGTASAISSGEEH